MDNALIQAIGFTAPIVCACVGILLLLIHLDSGRAKESPGHTLHGLLIGVLLVASLGWFGLILYVVVPAVFEPYQPVFLLSLMLDQVMLYQFVRILASTGQKSRFNPVHYVIPFVLTLLWFSLPFLFPRWSPGSTEAPVTALQWEDGEYVGMSVIFIVYNTLYPSLCLLCLHRYRRKVVDYSAESQRTSLHWLSAMMVLILVTVPFPLAGLLLKIDVFETLHLTWSGALPTAVVYLILCYNLISDNYVIIEPPSPTETAEPIRTLLERQYFERYIREKKPYLNPKLRITDMASDLLTNRTYLSAFINREYKMSFSHYVNRCRLQELDSLRAAPQRTGYTNNELVLMAGFSDYRSYARTKAEEDKNSLLKVF